MIRLGFLALIATLSASSIHAQTWQWTLSSTTDSLKRSFQPMRAEIPASQFEPALPKDPVPLYAQLQKIGEATVRPSQVMWSKTDAGKVVVMWMEESLLPNQAYKYQLSITQTAPAGAAANFKLTKVDSGIDVAHGPTNVYRYQDVYDAANYGETRRPFNHVYGSDGKYLTKGNEGEHPHQRGIFMGWDINGHGYWTDGGGTVQIHKSYDPAVEVMGPVFSRVNSTISWQHNKVEELVESRTVEAWWIKPGVTLLDFRFTLTEPDGKSFFLGGEGAHAGMQFRASDEVNVGRLDSITSAHPFSQDGPIKAGYNYTGTGHWIAQLFPVRGVKYMTMVMDHLDNPKPTEFPTRDYGRFGCFFNWTQPAGKALPLYYRFLITDRSVQDTAGIAAAYNSFQYPPVVTVLKGVSGLSREGGSKGYPQGGADARMGIRMEGRALRLTRSTSAKVSLFDLGGRLLAARELAPGGTLSLASIPHGLAWIQVRGPEGTMTRSWLMP
jgi:hypothetical protein